MFQILNSILLRREHLWEFSVSPFLLKSNVSFTIHNLIATKIMDEKCYFPKNQVNYIIFVSSFFWGGGNVISTINSNNNKIFVYCMFP